MKPPEPDCAQHEAVLGLAALSLIFGGLALVAWAWWPWR
jgi:hypothetical protein